MRFNMNKKLMFGLAAASFASLFWACGEGDIEMYDDDDRMVALTLGLDDGTDTTHLLDGTILAALEIYCQDTIKDQAGNPVLDAEGNAQLGAVNEECMEKAKPGNLETEAASSSSESSVKNPYKVSSSSAFSPFGGGSQQQNPTSSGNVTVLSSPSQQGTTSSPGGNHGSQTTPSSSSAIPVDPNAWGTCAANTTTNSIKKGASVQWKVNLDKDKVDAAIMTSGSFAWTFQDGNPGTATVQKSVTSPSVSYATSGEKTASVVVSYQGKTNTIQCLPLNVTGAEVTGCSCIPSESQIDIATQPRVTWSVTKCSSTETTFSYKWSDGLIGDNSASGDLNVKGTFAPTVTVKNADNGMMTVQCGAVTAIDSNNPDYVIKVAGQQGEIELPAGKKVTVVVDVTLNGGGNPKVICNADGPIGGTVNGTSFQAGASYYATLQLPAGTIKKGAQLVFELTSPAKCGVEN